MQNRDILKNIDIIGKINTMILKIGTQVNSNIK